MLILELMEEWDGLEKFKQCEELEELEELDD